jgi:hypothetical protein
VAMIIIGIAIGFAAADGAPPMSSVNPYMGMAGGAMQAADNLMNCKTKAECDAAMAATQHRNQQTQA